MLFDLHRRSKFEAVIFKFNYFVELSGHSIYRNELVILLWMGKIKWHPYPYISLNAADSDIVTELVGALNLNEFLWTQKWKYSVENAERYLNFFTFIFWCIIATHLL